MNNLITVRKYSERNLPQHVNEQMAVPGEYRAKTG